MTLTGRATIGVSCSPRTLARVEARTTPTLDPAGVIARDLARYYALLEWEWPGAIIS